jgi:hypothetical protein
LRADVSAEQVSYLVDEVKSARVTVGLLRLLAGDLEAYPILVHDSEWWAKFFRAEVREGM